MAKSKSALQEVQRLKSLNSFDTLVDLAVAEK